MFHHYGYEFVRHPVYAPMRERIRRPEAEGWETQVIILNPESAAKLLNGRQWALLACREPPAFLAVLRYQPRGGRAQAFAVVLPGLDDPTPPTVPLDTISYYRLPHAPQALLQERDILAKVWQHILQLG
jgi:hypothetical protein